MDRLIIEAAAACFIRDATFVAAVMNRPLLIDALERDEAAHLLPILTTGANKLVAIGTAYATVLIEQWQEVHGIDDNYDAALIA